MSGLAEKAVFALLAIGVHALALVVWPQDGARSQGAGGDSLITLQGATPQMETMVARWTEAADPLPPVEIAALQTLEAEAPDPALPRADRAPETATPPALPDLPETPVSPATPQPPLPVPLPAPQIAEAPRLPQPQPAQTTAEISEPAPEPPTLTQPRTTSPLTAPQAPEPPEAAAPPPPPEPVKPAPRAETARPAAAGAQAQRAAGSGGGTQAGDAGRAQAATLTRGQRASLMADWGARIRRRIERKQRFPRGVRSGGRVILNLRVGRDGTVLGIALQRSSGTEALDAAAFDAVRRAGRFPPAPEGLDARSYLFGVPLTFTLR